ncbi:MAG: hypothetical protein R3E31_09905 [Chloroflexota bacterium]
MTIYSYAGGAFTRRNCPACKISFIWGLTSGVEAIILKGMCNRNEWSNGLCRHYFADLPQITAVTCLPMSDKKQQAYPASRSS